MVLASTFSFDARFDFELRQNNCRFFLKMTAREGATESIKWRQINASEWNLP